MTLHLVGYPHTRLDGGFETCAYTQKVVKMRRMALDDELVVYGGPGADVVCIDDAERLELFGADDSSRMPAWPTDEQWRAFNERAIVEVATRARRGDLLLLSGGWSQKALADALPHLVACEPFVGYPGIVTERCAFESHVWRHYVYASKGIEDGRWWDTVIPNYFDPDDFPTRPAGSGIGPDYLLFVGRVTLRKGVGVAAEIAHRVGLPLLVAGPGATKDGDRLLGDHVEMDNVEYCGPVGTVERARLMAGAKALIAPTLYLEPFGGVVVEAQMCGTPTITTDWGAFTETVQEGVNGFRFTTMEEAVEAIEDVDQLDRELIRETAIRGYSLDAVAPRFDRWFRRLKKLALNDAWYVEESRVRG